MIHFKNLKDLSDTNIKLKESIYTFGHKNTIVSFVIIINIINKQMYTNIWSIIDHTIKDEP
jgi:hypothetical protein